MNFHPKLSQLSPPSPSELLYLLYQVLVACPPTSPHASNSPPSSFQVQGSNLAAFTLLPPNGFPVLPNFFVANPVTPKLPLHYHQHQWNLFNNTICHSLLLQSAIIFAQTKIATHNYIQHRKGKWLAANQRWFSMKFLNKRSLSLVH